MEGTTLKNITILGSTGSIGTQALEVIQNTGDKLVAISANTNVKLVEEQARRFGPAYAVIMDETAAKELKIKLADTPVKVLGGMDGLCEIAALPQNDMVLNSVVGMVGLLPTLAAIDAKTPVALANKETLVAAGELVTRKAKENRVPILPVDSEHSAIFQAMQAGQKKEVEKIILTASGGPFFGKTKEELAHVTAKEALKHPNWVMGAKLTIDSATMMNKGLEVIEAKWLFDLEIDQIEVLVHKESVIHSMVEFVDGSVIAQMGVPDMKIPIQYALTYPNRVTSGVRRLDLAAYGALHFAKADTDTFYCLKLCCDAAKKGGLYPCVASAAGEEAVRLFLEGKIRFLQIGEIVKSVTFDRTWPMEYTLDDVLQAQKEVKCIVAKMFS